jgi:hypothetical protein
MHVQTGGIGPSLVRVLQTAQPDLMMELLTPGRLLEADVVSVFQDRAVLSFGRGMRLEVSLQAELTEGQRVRVQVQPGAPDVVILKLLAIADGQNPQVQGQTTPMVAHPHAETPGAVWLPIPLPDGRQGWAQVQVREDLEGATRARTAGAPAHVRIWWETPELGQLQVALDTGGGALAAIFTVPGAESRSQLEQALPGLQQRLTAAGFPEVRVGCRPPRPGETVGPTPAAGASRIDQRL